MTTGLIFDIQRFSIHDGPGIRTTVFLKGCSLFCYWCHNPEGRRPRPEMQFSPQRCIGCGECATACQHGAHRMVDGVHVYEREGCVVCGRCANACCTGALHLTGRWMTVEELVAEVRRDVPFYETSGGGVTLSGGEPLLQPAFARAVLEACRAEGIHTAIETAANCRWQDLDTLLPVTDLVMMDIKHMNPQKHRQATGVSNARILENARRLAMTDKPLILRTPVIPTVNDTPEEIRQIALFVHSLTKLRRPGAPPLSLRLLPFHRLAADKFRSLGFDDRSSQLAPLSHGQMEELRMCLKSHGGAFWDCRPSRRVIRFTMAA